MNIGKLSPLYRDTISIKQRERIEKYGEVFTPDNVVKDMLDIIPDKETIGRTYLEPSCGDGNFLVEILQRKLDLCTSFEDIIVSLSSIYGIDIQADNVIEARRRMLGVLMSYKDFDDEQLNQIYEILYRNIILGNMIDDRMLKLSNDGYLLDFNKSNKVMLLASEAGRFDTYNLLGGDKSSYKASDIYNWYKLNGTDVTPEFCDNIIQYINGSAFTNRIAFYSCKYDNGKFVYDSEFLYDNEEESIDTSDIKTDFSASFLSGLNFG